MDYYYKLIKEICLEKGIKYSVCSNGWIIILEKEGKKKLIAGYKFDLNTHGLGETFDDKFATYDILSKMKIPVLTHHLLYSPLNKYDYAKNFSSYSLVYDFFDTHNKSIVLKPNNGQCGNGIYHITKKEDIKPRLDELFKSNFSISYCPYYELLNEYRVIVLNNQCQILYVKKRPIVLGNGKSTIKELLLKFNPHYFENVEKKEFAKVLAKGEKYVYDWRFNLDKGARPEDIQDITVKEKLLKFVRDITNKIDLEFCSVDIAETTDNELFVMEINSGVMMKNYMEIMPNGKKIAKDIYSKAIDAMFK